MHFLLIHSPLVTKETWLALVLALEGAGFEVTVISLDNAPADSGSYHERHVDQLLKLLHGFTFQNAQPARRCCRNIDKLCSFRPMTARGPKADSRAVRFERPVSEQPSE